MPRVLSVDPHEPATSAVEEAARALRAGELVAFPTETVYGLGARGLDAAHVARIFAAKGRPATHPMILHLASIEAVEALLGAPLSGAAARLARGLWPGPLTLVVPRAARVPPIVTAGLDTMAVRVPAHPVALALARALGEPIAAPSANAHTEVSPTTAAHVVGSLGDAVDLVLDGGPTPRGIESSVVDVTSPRPRLLRPGAASIEALRALAPDLEVPGAITAAADLPRASPGLAERHYAPRARVTLVSADALALRLGDAARATGVIVFGARATGAVAASAGRLAYVAALPAEPEGYAARLYACLHDADAAGCEELLVEAPPEEEAWLAVRDRLRRARAPG